MILKFVNHTHTHNHSHVYSHEVTMKVITGVGVTLCGFVILAFIFLVGGEMLALPKICQQSLSPIWSELFELKETLNYYVG